jgi:hypothetical protein
MFGSDNQIVEKKYTGNGYKDYQKNFPEPLSLKGGKQFTISLPVTCNCSY